jgi:type IV pilus assembly protein PilA
MKKILKKKGFTLIELIVVITILGILVAIAVPSILNYINEANTAVADANERTAKSEIGLMIATAADPTTVDDGSETIVLDGGTSLDCTWTSGDFPTAFNCTVTAP